MAMVKRRFPLKEEEAFSRLLTVSFAVGQPLVIADMVGLVLSGRELGPEGF